MNPRWLVVAGIPQMLAAQAPSLTAGDVHIERGGGFSWFSPGGHFGAVTNRRVYLAGIRRTTVERATGRLAVAYSSELTLAVVERTAPSGLRCFGEAQDGTRLCQRDVSAQVAVGLGGTPVGGRLYWNRSGRWRAHLGAGLGALVFSSDVPVRDSRRFNFTLEYGGGVEIPTAADRAVTVGYRFKHISNGGMADRNPGLDANVIVIGFTKRAQKL